ncbi:MAG: PEGA domain-containing protein [Candidatus Margulisiibacteriota bacterium]|nr:PEGA domain-containing protein [Candidatus Margulisiibacteriota bacterium]
MKKSIIILSLIILFSGIATAQFGAPERLEQATYGKLTVYSDVLGSDIYVDAKFIGQDRASVTNIPTGKHYVRVVKDKKTIQSGIVRVQAGEETVIVAKSREDQLEARQKKPNYVLFFGGLTDLGYNATVAGGTITYNYLPQLGFGAEVEFAVPNFDLRADVGFVQNYPSKITTNTGDAFMAISSPYLNLSKNLIKTTTFKINAGGGVNYAIFSPGYQTLITVSSKIGYQVFIEAVRSSGENRKLVFRIGYASYNGLSADPADINTSGIYARGGVGYQL